MNMMIIIISSSSIIISIIIITITLERAGGPHPAGYGGSQRIRHVFWPLYANYIVALWYELPYLQTPMCQLPGCPAMPSNSAPNCVERAGRPAGYWTDNNNNNDNNDINWTNILQGKVTILLVLVLVPH